MLTFQVTCKRLLVHPTFDFIQPKLIFNVENFCDFALITTIIRIFAFSRRVGTLQNCQTEVRRKLMCVTGTSAYQNFQCLW